MPDEKAIDEFDVIANVPTIIQIAGEDIHLEAQKTKVFRDFKRDITNLQTDTKMGPGDKEAFVVDSLIKIICKSISKSFDWFDNLPLDDAEKLINAFKKVNNMAKYFPLLRNLGPAGFIIDVTKISPQVAQAIEKQMKEMES
ncbi:hypothetical protein M0R01_03840 [bacterium]|nr:hypothetical protein [bacterium]